MSLIKVAGTPQEHEISIKCLFQESNTVYFEK